MKTERDTVEARLRRAIHCSGTHATAMAKIDYALKFREIVEAAHQAGRDLCEAARLLEMREMPATAGMLVDTAKRLRAALPEVERE